jgi:hypothetical protein
LLKLSLSCHAARLAALAGNARLRSNGDPIQRGQIRNRFLQGCEFVGRNRFIAPLGDADGIAPIGEADGAIKRLRLRVRALETRQ